MRGVLLIMGTFFFICPAISSGQLDASFTIPELAIVDIEPDNTGIFLTVEPPSEPGAGFTTSSSSKDNSKWLNYTCCLAPYATDRSVLVQITSGDLPRGISITVEASNYSGNGKGVFGKPAGKVLLGSRPGVLIAGIRGGYTGDGPYNGHMLTYSLSVASDQFFDFTSLETIEVTFTVTD